MADIKETTIARIMIRRWFNRFGTPEAIHTDRGASFERNLFKNLCISLDISKTATSGYNPKSNGMVER